MQRDRGRGHFDRSTVGDEAGLARGLARVNAERSRALRAYLSSLSRAHEFSCVLGRSAEIDRTLMRRNRLILTNRSADRTAWSTLLNYLRFIKYISNAAPRGCTRTCACVRARARAIPPVRRERVGRISRVYVCARARARVRALRARVCTTAVHNV